MSRKKLRLQRQQMPPNDIDYLEEMPTVVPAGKILVHNNVVPAKRIGGGSGGGAGGCKLCFWKGDGRLLVRGIGGASGTLPARWSVCRSCVRRCVLTSGASAPTMGRASGLKWRRVCGRQSVLPRHQ